MKPILFFLGPVPIYAYGLMLACALSISLLGVHWLSKYRDVAPQTACDALFWSFAGGLIGGRLYYVAFHIDYYIDHPLQMLYLHQGGLTWYGALIGSLVTLWVFCSLAAC